MIKSKIKIFLIAIISMVVLVAFTGTVGAQVAADAETYCARIHGTGNAAWIQCVNEKEAEIAACFELELENAQIACRRDALSYTETPTNPGEPNVPAQNPTTPQGDGWTGDAQNNVEQALQRSPIYGYLLGIINFLSIGVGIVITISVAVAGIQYSMSRGDPAQTAKAVNRITYALLALFLYVFGWSILNWLIPGGALNDLGEATGGIILWL